MVHGDENRTDRKIVLLIEDSTTQAILFQEILLDAGLNVICATSGRMGLRLARQVNPSLILLDVQMPDINGFQVCQDLKGHLDTKDIPVIMLTRLDSPEAVEQGLESGALDYIPKDAFATAVLLETVRQMGLIAGS